MFSKFSDMIIGQMSNADGDNVDIQYQQMISLLTQQITDLCYESLMNRGESKKSNEFLRIKN